MLNGLTSAVDTASGASHDFNELIVGCAVLDSLHNGVGIRKSACDTDLDILAGHGICGFLDTVCSSDLCKVGILKLLACQSFNRSSQSGLHNTAGCAEYDGGTGTLAQRIVKFLIGQMTEIDTCAVYHSGKLTCCQSDIDIRITGSGLIVTLCLKLFGCARHDADNNYVCGVDAHFLCIPGLYHRTEHLLRGLAG